MKEKTKLIYSALYVSFLIALLVLFAVVHNNAPGIIPFYIVLFAVLIIVTALFITVHLRKDVQVIQVIQDPENTEKHENTTSKANPEKKEKDIDLQKIIPRTNDIYKYTEELLQNMAKVLPVVQALLYVRNPNEDLFHCYAEYAYFSEEKPAEFRTGETLSGQAVKNKTIVSLDNVPEKYMIIASGLGKSDPKHLVFVPLKNHDEVLGLIEYASFSPLTESHAKALEDLSKKTGETISKHLKSK